ncbi:MAG: hypothetical protein K2M74_00945 [Bacteroidales bacterium]|nr:hypothetical protein [Bacteroidales bacterium]
MDIFFEKVSYIKQEGAPCAAYSLPFVFPSFGDFGATERPNHCTLQMFVDAKIKKYGKEKKRKILQSFLVE